VRHGSNAHEERVAAAVSVAHRRAAASSVAATPPTWQTGQRYELGSFSKGPWSPVYMKPQSMHTNACLAAVLRANTATALRRLGGGGLAEGLKACCLLLRLNAMVSGLVVPAMPQPPQCVGRAIARSDSRSDFCRGRQCWLCREWCA
jgi:hypothetical protein